MYIAGIVLINYKYNIVIRSINTYTHMYIDHHRIVYINAFCSHQMSESNPKR